MDRLQSNYDVLLRFEEENIEFPPFVTAFKAIEEQLTLFRHTGMAKHLLVLGESGTGKSTLCKLLVQKYPRIVLPERDVVPVLHVSVPASATIAAVSSEILRVLGDPDPNRGTVPARTLRIIVLCRACRVELLLVDEAQHMHDRGKKTTHYLVGDWLKRLIDELGVPSVFLGLPRFEKLLQVNEQLRRRFSRRLWLALGHSEEASVETECLQLFVSLATCMPIPLSYGEYGVQEFGQRLFLASDGRVAYIKKLLQSALESALFGDYDQITPRDLEQAFTHDIWREGVERLNPFHINFVFRRLDRAGEPFESGAEIGTTLRR